MVPRVAELYEANTNLNQPPDSRRPAPTDVSSSWQRPNWARPPGVAAGTWQYVNQRSIADRYDAFVADTPLCQLDAEIIERLFPNTKNLGKTPTTVVDLGCGSGRTTIPLAQRGYRVFAIDLSQRMLEVLRGKLTSDLESSVVPLRANLVELEFLADNCVDHAVCMFSTLGMIQGRKNRRAMLTQAARIVRDGGSLLLHVHNRWSAFREPDGLKGLMRSAWRALRDSECEFGDSTYAYRGLEEMFMHRFTRRELLADLRESGWDVSQLWRVAIDGSSLTTNKIPGGYIVHCTQATSF